MTLKLEAVPMGAQVSMLVPRCPDCTHPQSFHTNSCCSNAGCFCRRVFSQASSPTLIASNDDAQNQGG